MVLFYLLRRVVESRCLSMYWNETWNNFKVDMIIVWIQALGAIPQADPEHKKVKDRQSTENDGPDPGQTAPSPVLFFEW